MRIALISLTLLCAACQEKPAAAPGLPPPPPHPNGQVLWGIVHGQCVPDEEKSGRPDPCIAVSLPGGEARGYAVLRDKHGSEQYLVMPTIDITGIEDARLLAPGAPNYFADAWASKPYVDHLIGKTTPRQDMAVSVNSPYGRSQDLLHLHVDCLTPESLAALTADAPKINGHWSRAPFTLDGHLYYAMRLMGETPPANPFDLLAEGIPGARQDMGAWTLILAGAQFDGQPGFILLANRADPLHGDFASGEELQDHECRIARAG
ncbi:MAG: CDP-diacylglycerol diphosphatase [Caulobacteraceae bacterium]|nr:CDP-diacylglycerol diphosphatase [Caulobacteraceae bacterium]